MEKLHWVIPNKKDLWNIDRDCARGRSISIIIHPQGEAIELQEDKCRFSSTSINEIHFKAQGRDSSRKLLFDCSWSTSGISFDTISSLSLTDRPVSLTSSSPTFVRPYGTLNSNYYYQAFQVSVATTGRYKLISNSSIDTYGYLYLNPVNPRRPLDNLMLHDDDSGGNQQFLLTANLSSGTSYSLIVTTSEANVTGDFWIRASGPSSINLIAFVPTTTTTVTTTTATTTTVTTTTVTRTTITVTTSELIIACSLFGTSRVTHSWR